MSKGDILEHVRDFAYEGDPNIVEVYVGALRRKLGASLIRTARRLPPGGPAMERVFGSVRSRAALAATLVVAVALVAAGTAVLLALRSNLTGQAGSAADSRCAQGRHPAGHRHSAPDALDLDSDDRAGAGRRRGRTAGGRVRTTWRDHRHRHGRRTPRGRRHRRRPRRPRRGR